MGIGLEELSFGVGMAVVTNPVYSLLDKILNIRAVRIVACIAFLIDKRSMGDLCFLSLLRFRVTPEAQLTGFGVQEILVFGRMGRMTGKASFFTGDRGMVEGNLAALLFVTVKTEAVDILKNKSGILRGVGLMAGFTGSLFKRSVVNFSSRRQLSRVMTIGTELTSCLVGAERFWIGRWLMTGIALGGGHGIVSTCFQKLRL